MSFHIDSPDPEWKVTKLKTEPGTVKDLHNTSTNKVKYTQKFCEKWLSLFSPWLARCEDDQSKPFCRACQCRLDCNRCHLQRHEKTTKHARNLEILINKGEGAARQNLSIRQERSKYYQQRRKVSSSVGSQEDCDMGMEDFIDEPEQQSEWNGYEQTDEHSEDQFVPEEKTCKQETINIHEMNHHMIVSRPATKSNNIGRPRKIAKTTDSSTIPNIHSSESSEVAERKDPMKTLMQIQKDKSELMDSIKELIPPPREKNHVDLFFESVSSSVKALSPKLIAETKMRVSQLICELELRALTENEHANNVQAPNSSVVVSQDNSAGAYIINQAVNQPEANQHVDDLQQYET